ncbi:hypothetical protein ACFVMC_03200 [Nocardia sp. NPDC127579]|uniref:hypothetical protein n=1 Tax=Nocardia sp. NPDC127579 TaxID=3345402 RepID=UPI0036331ECC
MSKTKNVLVGTAAIAGSVAMMIGGTGVASASPVVHQQLGSCTWSADVVPIGGVPMNGYGVQWYVKTGRTDNSGVGCSFEVFAKFGMQSGGEREVRFGSNRHAHDQPFAEGPARILQVGLKLCVDGQGCTNWNVQNSVWM